MANEFEVFWKPFIRVFQAFCVSHYSIFRPNFYQNYRNNFQFLIYFVVCSSIYIIFVFSTLYGAFMDYNEYEEVKQNSRPIMYYVNTLNTFCSYATHLAIPFENLFYGKRENEICKKLKQINDTFATKLNYIPDYKARRNRYLYRPILIFVFDILLAYASVFVILPESDEEDASYVQPTVMIGIIILRVRWCQVALFLDVIADTLRDLQVLLKQQQLQSIKDTNNPLQNKFTRQRIQYFRDIYSNIWLITILMSDCFGWTLIAFLIKVTLELIKGAYWFYINTRVNESITLNIGETGNFEIIH